MSAVTRVECAKEMRALAPIWGACLVALAGAYLQPRGVLMQLAVAAYIIGPSMLGAHAIGQDNPSPLNYAERRHMVRS